MTSSCHTNAVYFDLEHFDDVAGLLQGLLLHLGFLDKPLHDVHARAIATVEPTVGTLANLHGGGLADSVVAVPLHQVDVIGEVVHLFV